MTEPQVTSVESPSRARIALATVGALLVASVVLAIVVLPAEYGLDPLGTGQAFGLLALGETTDDTPPVLLNTAVQPGGHNARPAAFSEETRRFTIPAGEGMEYKYRLEEGASLVYSWVATANVNYDLHAEPDGSPRGYAESFDKEDNRDTAYGSYTAPFPGVHGWYWENTTRSTITVSLTTAGFYDASVEYRPRVEPKVTWFE
jgi:hypothetical protein